MTEIQPKDNFYKTSLKCALSFPLVTSIPNYCFNTSGVKDISLPSVTSFGGACFGGLSLTNVVLRDATSLPDGLFNGGIAANCSVHFLGNVPTFGVKTFNNAKAAMPKFYVHGLDYVENWRDACFAHPGEAAFETFKANAPKHTIGVIYANSDTGSQANWGLAYVVDANKYGFVISFQ